MCGPAAASLAVQGFGAVSSAAGAMFSASTQKMGLKLDAAIAKINADKARDAARETLREGYEMEVRQRTATGLVKGAQRAAMGANNVDMTTGSALNRLVSTDYVGEADAQTIRLNAARAAMGYRDEASNQEIRATLSRGAAAGISPLLTGATSLLGSAASIASNWYSLKQAGAFGSNAKINAPDLSSPMPVGLTVPTLSARASGTLDAYRYGTLG